MNKGAIRFEVVKIDQLKPYERNARRHTEKDLSKIRESIARFGFDDPIGVWGKDNIIVEGHGRWLAAKELGMTEVPVIRLDHLSNDERKAYGLAHNRTAELSTWDFGKLTDELNDLGDFGMSDFGFDFGETYQPVETDGASAQWTGAPNDDGYMEYQNPVSDDELKRYEDAADDFLLKRRVIITFLPEQEETLKSLLGLSGDLKVIYQLDELIGEEQK